MVVMPGDDVKESGVHGAWSATADAGQVSVPTPGESVDAPLAPPSVAPAAVPDSHTSRFVHPPYAVGGTIGNQGCLGTEVCTSGGHREPPC